LFYRFTVPKTDFELLKASQSVMHQLKKRADSFFGLFRKTPRPFYSGALQLPAWAQSKKKKVFSNKKW
jgi:hypothetical protein